MQVGLVAAPGASVELANLPFDVSVVRDPAAASVDLGRAWLLEQGWDAAVCVADGPLWSGGRRVRALVSPVHRVAVVSKASPEAIADAVGQLVPAPSHRAAAPTAPTVGALLRATQPWTLAARLTRALLAAIAAVTFALVNGEVWRLSDALGWPRLAGLTIVSGALTAAALLAGHDLLERRRSAGPFNLVTALTVVIGVLVLQAALFLTALAGAALLVHADVLAHGLAHPADAGDYVGLAWLASSVAMIGGALGAALESDDAVRHAAYRYRAQ